MTSTEFVNKCVDIAKNYKTHYLYGTFGAPVTKTVITQKSKQYAWFYTASKIAECSALIGKGYFGFDCVGLIKGILWGWNGTNSGNGGAKYQSNNVPDVSANGMIAKCSGVSTNFSNIVAGEVVWLDGHIGVYIGNGLVVECSPKWANDVQITALANIGNVTGYNSRRWTKHGKLPYITYNAAHAPTDAPTTGVTEYTVKSGDSLWKIAQTTLGNGARYTEIAALNGITANTIIHAGDVLKIPTAAKNGVVTALFLNVRKGAGTNYARVKIISKGTAVKITGENNGWYFIGDGWVSAKYISV